MGKTAFVLNLAQHITIHEHLCAAIFSLEMSKEQLVNRLFALESRVDAQKLRTGNLQEADWENLIEGAGKIGNSKLIIDDTPGISIGELRSKCRKFKMELTYASAIIAEELLLFKDVMVLCCMPKLRWKNLPMKKNSSKLV